MPVYMIQAGTMPAVKIGYTKKSNPSHRLAAMQHYHYEKLRLIRLVAGSSLLESVFHYYFWPLHIRGEWFKFDPEMLTVSIESVQHNANGSGAPLTKSWLTSRANLTRASDAEYLSWFASR